MIRVSRLFHDRSHGGRVLAARLDLPRDSGLLVIGLARGGVPVAAEVAEHLDADLDVLVVRKLGAPDHEELAIGAITADGSRWLNAELIGQLGVDEEYIERLSAQHQRAAQEAEAALRSGRPAQRVAGRTVILVDDGLATGATMRAAVRSVRLQDPARIVVAAPAGSPDACAELADVADQVVCAYRPDPFLAVGLYYEDFAQVSDREVREILAGRA